MKMQSVLSAVAIAGMLVVTADYASMAATGGSFILGHSNSANQSTKLTNTGTGPVLKLSTTHPGTRAPLGVNSSVKVANLNADKVDGLTSTQLTSVTKLYTDTSAGDKGGLHYWHFTLAPGSYTVSYAAHLRPTTGTGAAPNSVFCSFFEGSSYRGGSSTTYVGAFTQSFLNGTDTIKATVATPIDFFCQVTDGTFALQGGAGIRISVTKLTSSTAAVLPDGAAPRTAPRAGAGSSH